MFKKIEFKNLPIDSDSLDKYSIALIIPHQNNIENLQKLLNYIQKKESDKHIDIFIIDQNNADKFNRGLLLNIGYLIAMKHFKYDRYIFHNVNYFPNDKMFDLYFKFVDYNICFDNSGLNSVFGIKKEDFEKINGFPNNFFGNDVDNEVFYNRCAKYDIKIYKSNTGSFEIVDNTNKPNLINKSNILHDIKNSQANGLKQLLNFFVNIKKYSIDNFISNYNIIDRNSTNNSESFQNFIQNKIENQKIFAFKIDYLSVHTSKYETLLNKNYVEEKIKKRLEQVKGLPYFQHPKHPEIISSLEPIVYLDEINQKIIKTYTELKPFNLDITKKISKRENKIKKIVENNFEKYKITSEFRNKEDLFSTIKFIFETFNELVYFRIRNNKLECSYHLYNRENKVDWFQYIKTIDNKTIDENIINVVDSIDKPYFTIRKPHFLPSNNCLLGFDSYNYWDVIPLGYVKEFKEMINYTINKFKEIPDCDIVINRKDFALITKDNKYAYDHLLVGDQAKIKDIDRFYFFGTQSIKDNNIDIPIPAADEWKNIMKYKTLKKSKWEDKKSIAFFRGSSTGCGQTIETNPRFKLADISYQWSRTNDKNNYLDCALTALTRRIRLYKQFIGIKDLNKYDYLLGSFLDSDKQLEYKYIFNLEGNAQAYRFSTEFRKYAVILNVESEFKMWFNPLLKENKNIITIKSDFSNLLEKLEYLKKHDDKAKKIADSGYKFSKKYINENMIATYWYYYMFNINKLTKTD